MNLSGLGGVLYDIVHEIVDFIRTIILNVLENFGSDSFQNKTFNVYLFSESGWFSESISVDVIFTWILTLFVTFFTIKIIYRFVAKLVRKLFGVIRL